MPPRPNRRMTRYFVCSRKACGISASDGFSLDLSDVDGACAFGRSGSGCRAATAGAAPDAGKPLKVDESRTPGVDWSLAGMPAAACRKRVTSVSRGVCDRNVEHVEQSARCTCIRPRLSGVSLPKAKAANCLGVGCVWFRVSMGSGFRCG